MEDGRDWRRMEEGGWRVEEVGRGWRKLKDIGGWSSEAEIWRRMKEAGQGRKLEDG